MIKSAAKRTRQQRLANINQQLLDRLNSVEREAGKFEKALMEYAYESNWAMAVEDPTHNSHGQNDPCWLGPGTGPSLARDALNPSKLTMANPDSGKSPVQTAKDKLHEP